MMDLRRFKRLQATFRDKVRARKDQRIECYDTDMTFREEMVEEMLMDVIERLEKLEELLAAPKE